MPRDEFPYAEMHAKAAQVADLHRFRAKSVRWVEYRPPLTKLELRKKHDCLGDCRAVARAHDDSLYEQGLYVEWAGEFYGFHVVQLERQWNAELGRYIFIGICPHCGTLHWSDSR